jgi:hypothetical protein
MSLTTDSTATITTAATPSVEADPIFAAIES